MILPPRPLILATALALYLGTLMRGAAADPSSAVEDPALRQRPGEQSIDDALEALITAVDRAEAAMENGTQAEDRGTLWKKYSTLNRESLPKIAELVARSPKSETAAVALAWIATNRMIVSGSMELKHFGREAIERLATDYVESPKIGRACWLLGDGWSEIHLPSLRFLERVAEKNPSRSIRGQASFALARIKKNWSEGLVYFESQKAVGETSENQFTEEYTAMTRLGNAEDYRNQAKALFEEVANKYADCDVPQEHRIRQVQRTLGGEAKKELFELTRLSVGCEAPEIIGQDLEGRDLRLSDYRGKVVLLSFWASWCGPCMQMIDREKPLAERLAGKPFVMLGVNGDSSLKDATNAAGKKKVSWRSFWSGTEGPNGPIPDLWNVRYWPTQYLLDQHGVIRAKQGDLKYIEKVIDRLLAEMEPTKT